MNPHRAKRNAKRARQIPQSPSSFEALKKANQKIHLQLLREREMAKTLEESEARYRAMADSFDGMVYICSRDHKVEFVNTLLKKRTGYDPIGKPCYRVLHDRNSVCPWCPNKLIFRGKNVRFERQSPKDGRWYQGIHSPVYHPDGSVSKMGTLVDITDKKHAAISLQNEKEKFKAIFNQTFQLIGLMKNDGTLLEVNQTALDYTGAKASEVRNKLFWKTPWWRHSKQARIRLRKAVESAATGKFIRYETSIAAHDEGVRFIDFSIKPVRDRRGKIIYLIPEGRDVTDRKVVEKALLQSETMFRTLTERLPNLVFIIQGGRVVYANHKCEKVTGYKPEEFFAFKFSFLDLVHPDDSPKARRNYRIHQKGGEVPPCEYKIITKSGKVIHAILTTRLIQHYEKPAILAILTDITERKEAETALAQREAYLSAIIENQPGMVWLKDREGRFLSVNQKFADACGLKNSKDVTGKTDFDIWSKGLAAKYRADDKKTMKTGKPIRVEEPIATRGVQKWYETFKTPVVNTEGNIIGTSGYAQDITERKRMEVGLKESEAKFRAAFETSPSGTALCEMDGRLVQVNQAYLSIIGYTNEEALKLTYWDLTPKEYAAQEAKQLHSMKKTGRYGPYEKEYIRKTGERIPVLLNGAIIVAGDGRRRIWSVVFDITERKRAEEDLNRLLSLQRATLESTADGILVVNCSGHIDDCNEKFRRLWRIPKKILKSHDDRKILRFVSAQLKSPEEFFARIREYYQHPEKSGFDVLEFKDGRVFERYTHPQMIGEKPAGRVWSFRDITVRKKTEEALLLSQQRTGLHIKQTSLAAIEWDENFRVREWNPAAEKIFGYAAKEALGRHYRFVVPEIARGRVDSVGRALMEQKGGQRSANENITKDGKIIFCEWYNTTLIDPAGKTVGVASLVEDVTERKKTEAALRLAYFSINHAEDSIFQIDSQGAFLYVNDAVCRNLEYSREELLSMTVHDIDPNFPSSVWPAHWKELRRKRHMNFEATHQTKTGRMFPVEIDINYLKFEGKEYNFAFARDISERKLAEENLRESQRQLREIIDTVPHLICAKDIEGRFLMANRAMAELYGMRHEELLGKKQGDLHPVKSEVESILRDDRDVILTGMPKVIVTQLFMDIKNRERYLQAFKVPFKVPGINEPAVLVVAVDVTEQKKIEDFRNEIVRTLSHELRTPLSIEKGGISLLLDGSTGEITDEQKLLLETVMRNIDRLSRMIDNLLDVSRIESGKRELVFRDADLRDIVRETVLEFEHMSKHRKIKLAAVYPDEEVHVCVDRDGIMQVLINLIGNALKFTPKGKVEVSVRVLREEVECDVRDTGIGISHENMAKMFEKFQQFSWPHGPGKEGIGLGLVIAKGIIEMHRGRIWAKSVPGKGTTVTFVLPRSPRKGGVENGRDNEENIIH